MSNKTKEIIAKLKYVWQRLKTYGFGTRNTSSFKPSPVGRELLALSVFALSLAMILALMSFNALDIPKSFGDEFENYLGFLGSWIAIKLLLFFGIFAVIVPLLGFYISFRLVYREKSSFTSLQILGLFLIISGIIPVVSYIFKTPIKQTFLVAGFMGSGASRGLILLFSITGLWLISLAFIIAGLLLLLRRPFIANSISALGRKLSLLARQDKSSITMLKPIECITKQAPTILAPKEVVIPVLKPIATDANESDIQIVERDIDKTVTAVKKAEGEGGKKESSFVLPPLNLLDYDAPVKNSIDTALLKKEADKLQRAFLQFGIEGKIREIRPGPVVTNYEFVPVPGIKLSRIAALSDDIAMAMSAVQVRIVTPIPGKGAVGIEVPNEQRETVYLKEIVADERYRKESHKLSMAIGKDVEGNPYFMNLADMPHILIAGTTGSGKSVSVNAMICSILYRATPNDVRFLMIDPKMLELSVYSGIPHLLLPPIIDAKKAANALRWAVKEMDQRYSLMKEASVRDIATYNDKLKLYGEGAFKEVNGRQHEHLPYIVIVVDEYADLLAIAGKEVEGYVMRLAQKARACGIHVMLATQRPSVDVITGVIKANFPVRMGFRLASSHDSKTIINKTGAEKLLGRGDVLIMPPGSSDLIRIHGAFISEKELFRVVEFLSAQKTPDYREEIADFNEDNDASDTSNSPDKSELDEKFSEAWAIVREHNKCSTSFLQRHLCVGYNRAARIVEQMEKKGMVGPVQNAKGEREIFINVL